MILSWFAVKDEKPLPNVREGIQGWTEYLDFALNSVFVLNKEHQVYEALSSCVTECSPFWSAFTGIVRWIKWDCEGDAFLQTVKSRVLLSSLPLNFCGLTKIAPIGYFLKLRAPIKFLSLKWYLSIKTCPFAFKILTADWISQLWFSTFACFNSFKIWLLSRDCSSWHEY